MALFARGGLPAVTVRAIGRAAGASTGSIYHHFPDLGALLLALYRQIFRDEIFPALMRGLRSRADPEEALAAAIDAYLDWIVARPEQARFVYAASGTPALAPHAAAVAAMKRAFLDEVGQWLAPHVRSGAIRALPGWAWDPILFGPVHEVARRYLAGAHIDLGEARSLLAEVAWRAVRAP